MCREGRSLAPRPASHAFQEIMTEDCCGFLCHPSPQILLCLFLR